MLINYDTYQRETLSERRIRQPLTWSQLMMAFCLSMLVAVVYESTPLNKLAIADAVLGQNAWRSEYDLRLNEEL